MAWSARQLSHQVSSLNAKRNGIIAERNEARANLYQLQQAAGDLQQLQAKLSATQAEYSRVVELTDRKTAKDRDSVSQTGSIRKAETPKRPAR